MRIKALFLDFNGVILDDRELSYRSTRAVFTAFGVTNIPTLEEWRSCIGSNYMDFYRKYGIPPNLTSSDLNNIRNKFIFENWNEVSVRPYCADILRHLRRNGLETAIVSAETRPLLEKRIKENNLDILFDRIYADASPKKDHLVTALDEFGLKAEEVLFVEDSAEGVVAGNELGLLTIAFLNETSYSFHHRLEVANPKFRIVELSDLIDLVSLINIGNIKT
ncbi:MAG: HAD family phosphatase [Candidatus Yanofskybacteria bacterium]|nr:HAD family phosphatase [Candidatus Yanofskybacteria bacterium]